MALRADINQIFVTLSEVFRKRATQLSAAATAPAYKLTGTVALALFAKEAKKEWECSVKEAVNVEDIKDCVTRLEAAVHDQQLPPDRRDAEQEQLVRRRKMQQMRSEGWLFEAPPPAAPSTAAATASATTTATKAAEAGSSEAEPVAVDRSKGCEYLGKSLRRFFHNFGLSDGRIVCYLPADLSDEGEGTLFHMVSTLRNCGGSDRICIRLSSCCYAIAI